MFVVYCESFASSLFFVIAPQHGDAQPKTATCPKPLVTHTKGFDFECCGFDCDFFMLRARCGRLRKSETFTVSQLYC